MMRRSPRSMTVAVLACTLTATALLGACSHDDRGMPHRGMPHRGNGPMHRSGTTTASPQRPGDPDRPTLEVPVTLPDGNFPSVADPERDGSLADVHVKATTVATADRPIALVARPGHDDQLFLAERGGFVRLATIGDDGGLTIGDEPLVDMSGEISTDGETGLLGLAFAPDGDTLYLSYNVENHDSRVDAAPVTGDGDTTEVGDPTNLFGVDQMGTVFHKGGNLVVDDDGLLYAGFGDGGPQNDADEHAQDPHLLLGKILRIDPARPADGRPYGIPDGNPYADGTDGAPEIWLIGLRNPWRFSIDPDNGDVWIGDVGQDAIEEVDRLPGGRIADGRNLGWSGYEGTFVFAEGRVAGPSVPPIFELAHDDGVCSITGGVVYRGSAIAGLEGTYVYSDLCRPGVHGIRADTPSDAIGHVTDERLLEGTGDIGQIISFATDARGEVYVLSMDDTIRRLDPADPPG